jgi:acetyltransferase-like isoleucine patch superfamily enzyme
MNNPLKSSSVHLVRHLRMWGRASVPWSCFIGENVEIESQVVVRPHVRLEKNVCLHRNSVVGQYAVLSNVEVGEGSHIEYGVVITGYGNGRIVIGRESYIGIYNVLDWSDDLTIGNFVHIAGPSTGIWTHTSVQQALAGDPLFEKANRQTKPIHIEDCVYIGGNCTVYPGVTIGHHSVIAPNSAVTSDVSPHTVVGGVPAKVISERHPNSSV